MSEIIPTMIEGGTPAPEGVDRSRLPKAEEILDVFDATLHPRVLALGAPSLGEPLLTGSAVHEKYGGLSRGHFSDLVDLDTLREVTGAGRINERTEGEGDSFSHFVVYETAEGDLKLSDSQIGSDRSSSLVRYEASGDTEKVVVQHSSPENGSRLFDLTLGEDYYRFGSERRVKGEPMILASGYFKDGSAGTITGAHLEVGKFDG